MSFVFSFLLYAQDAESLGDVARQTREQRRAKAAQSKDDSANGGEGKSAVSKTPKIITNDEIPEHPEESPATSETSTSSGNTSAQPSLPGESKPSAEQWKYQIQAQQNVVTALKTDIERLERSIVFAPGNCVSGCVQWNERQKHKQEQVEQMKADLEQQQNCLETMQEMARRQGYGSSVYEP
jgi:hypothetical protein